MLSFLNFVRFERMCRKRRTDDAIALYEKTKFSEKYQILADILFGEIIGFGGNKGQSIDMLRKCMEKMENYGFYNEPTRQYIRNYIIFSVNQLKGDRDFRIDASRSPIARDEVDRYIASAFFHKELYF